MQSTNYKRPHMSFLKILTFFIVTISILMNSGYAGMMSENSSPVYFLVILLVLELILIFIYRNKVRIYKSGYVFIGLLFIIIIGLVANNEYNHIRIYINLVLMILTAFILSNIITFNNFIKSYVNVVFAISLIAIVLFLSVNLLSFNLPHIVTISPNTTYLNSIIYFQIQNNTQRNIGVFWEPGLFASYIIIAIFFIQQYLGFKSNKFRTFVLITALITTSSTAGYLLFLLIMVNAFIGLKDNMRAQILTLIISAFIVLMYLFYSEIISFLVTINPNVFSKLSTDTISYATRLIAPSINLKIFSESPLYGVGFGEATRLFVELTQSTIVDSQTSTSTYFLAASGVLGVLYTYYWIRGIYNSLGDRPFITRLISVTLFLMIINKEPHNSLAISYCILFFFNTKKTYNTISLEKR